MAAERKNLFPLSDPAAVTKKSGSGQAWDSKAVRQLPKPKDLRPVVSLSLVLRSCFSLHRGW